MRDTLCNEWACCPQQGAPASKRCAVRIVSVQSKAQPDGVREGELAALLKDLDLHSAWENQESKEDSQGEGVTSTNDPVDVPRKTVSTVMQPERWPPPGACV